jgi:hypothetical protein
LQSRHGAAFFVCDCARHVTPRAGGSETIVFSVERQDFLMTDAKVRPMHACDVAKMMLCRFLNETFLTGQLRYNQGHTSLHREQRWCQQGHGF